METCERLRIDPGSLETDGFAGELDIVGPTRNGCNRCAAQTRGRLDRGLNARLTLVAVHTVRIRVVRMPARCTLTWWSNSWILPAVPLSVNPQVVLARGRAEGFAYVLKPESIVLLGAWKHWWRTGRGLAAAWLGTVIKWYCCTSNRYWSIPRKGQHA